MAIQKLVIDTDIVIDYLNRRDPYFEDARLLMLAGLVGEFELWITSSQVTEIVYIMTDGGKESRVKEALERLRALRTFLNVQAVTASDVDRMLATAWPDPEDALIVDLALKMRADAVITRDKDFPRTDMIRVHDCASFFAWLEAEKGVSYAEVAC